MRSLSDSEVTAFLLEGTRTAKLSVVRKDGSPFVTPVWFLLDDDGAVVFETERRSVKGRAIARDPRVSLCVEDDRPPFGFVRLDGVAEISEGNPELLGWTTRIAARYMGPRASRRDREPERRRRTHPGPCPGTASGCSGRVGTDAARGPMGDVEVLGRIGPDGPGLLVLYTGGTIGMGPGPDGTLVPLDLRELGVHLPFVRRLPIGLTVATLPNPIDSSAERRPGRHQRRHRGHAPGTTEWSCSTAPTPWPTRRRRSASSSRASTSRSC